MTLDPNLNLLSATPSLNKILKIILKRNFLFKQLRSIDKIDIIKRKSIDLNLKHCFSVTNQLHREVMLTAFFIDD
jgi:hypothetical protein